MKRLQLSLLALSLAGASMAQRTSGPALHVDMQMPFLSGMRTPTDTIVPTSLATSGSSLVLYPSTSSGYIVGTNNFGDKAKVQVFNSTGAVIVEQLLYLFGAKDDNGTPNAMVHARVYGLDGQGTNTADASVNTAPGTVLGNMDVPISGCDTTGNLTVVAFSPAVSVTGNFGGGFDVADLPTGVQIGLVTTTDGDPGTATDQNWEKFSDDTWWTLSNATASWGRVFDFAILAVLGDGVAGIDDATAVNNMRMSFVGANPASSDVTLAYDMLQDANGRLMVMDLKGARMIDQQLGRTSAGRHQTSFDVSDWANGTYYVTLFANGNPITKKLVVKH